MRTAPLQKHTVFKRSLQVASSQFHLDRIIVHDKSLRLFAGLQSWTWMLGVGLLNLTLPRGQFCVRQVFSQWAVLQMGGRVGARTAVGCAAVTSEHCPRTEHLASAAPPKLPSGRRCAGLPGLRRSASCVVALPTPLVLSHLTGTEQAPRPPPALPPPDRWRRARPRTGWPART